MNSTRHRQVGGAALLLLLVLGGLALLIGVLAIRGALTDMRAAGNQRSARAGFYCAEGGLNAGRAYFASNYALWSSMFDSSKAAPAGYPVVGDLDGDGVNDYQVTLVDNVDEFPPLANNPLVDNDLTAIMVSRCTNAAMGTRQLRETVLLNTRGNNYRAQAGHGSNHAGNTN